MASQATTKMTWYASYTRFFYLTSSIDIHIQNLDHFTHNIIRMCPILLTLFMGCSDVKSSWFPLRWCPCVPRPSVSCWLTSSTPYAPLLSPVGNELRAITSTPPPDPSTWAFSRQNDLIFASHVDEQVARIPPEEWVAKGYGKMQEALADIQGKGTTSPKDSADP